jgi:hypothetical protein
MPRDILGIRFACNVAIATSLIWYALAYLADTNPLWAIASMVARCKRQSFLVQTVDRLRPLVLLTSRKSC